MIRKLRAALHKRIHANCTNLTHAEAARIYQEAYDMRLERDSLHSRLEHYNYLLRRSENELQKATDELRRAKETQAQQHAQDEAARQQAVQERAAEPKLEVTSLTMFVVWLLVVVSIVALGVAVWVTIGG